jgi:hypothetical protein
MITTTSIHLHPAQAVGDPAQGRGADGNGGGTAGTPLAGVGAVSADGSHSHETPLLRASTRRARSPKSKPEEPNPPRKPQASSPILLLGSETHGLEGAGMPHPIKLRKRCFRFGTWNMQGCTSRRDMKLTNKFTLLSNILGADKLDVLILTETHCRDMTPPPGISILAATWISTARAGIAIITRSNKGWSCLDAGCLQRQYCQEFQTNFFL